MKTLLIGFYDYDFVKTAYLLENGLLTNICDLFSESDFERLEQYSCKWGPFNKPDIEDILIQYDQVIVCEDGEYTILK